MEGEEDLNSLSNKDFVEISDRVSLKIKEIKKAQAELIEIQNMCKHTETEIRNISSSGLTFALRKVCSDCEKILAYPTTEESNKWMS